MVGDTSESDGVATRMQARQKRKAWRKKASSSNGGRGSKKSGMRKGADGGSLVLECNNLDEARASSHGGTPPTDPDDEAVGAWGEGA